MLYKKHQKNMKDIAKRFPENPSENYELTGFFGYVVFTNGHIVNGDTVTIYYGPADEVICGASFSLK